MTTPNRRRAPKGTPTALNLSTLAEWFGCTPLPHYLTGKHPEPLPGLRAPNRIPPTAANGLRRCMKAGLVTIADGELALTDMGVEAIIDAGYADPRANERASSHEHEPPIRREPIVSNEVIDMIKRGGAR